VNKKYNNKHGSKEAIKTSWSSTTPISSSDLGVIKKRRIKINNYFLFPPSIFYHN